MDKRENISNTPKVPFRGFRGLKKLLLSIIALTVAINANAFFPDYYDQYENLYPGCIDNEPSKIYSLDEPFLEPPLFPGGGPVQMSRFVHFATEILNVRDESGDQLRGRVLVRTVIDRCGEPTLIRVVRNFPTFKPGSLDGIRVKVAITVPVYFTRTYVPRRRQSTW